MRSSFASFSSTVLVAMMAGPLAACLAGCSSTAAAPVEVVKGTPVTPTPFTDNTGEAATTTAQAYPAGPYGYTPGSTIPNFQFDGFPDPATNHSALKPIYLSDFYNPHGLDKTYTPPAGEADDRLFPAGSGYENAGKLKPVVLLVDVASVWCGPCNEEAAQMLPFKHAMYGSCGAEFLLDLHDSGNPGTTATQGDLKNWTVVYGVNYPAMIDPSYKLDVYFAEDAYPTNMIIDTTTMKIVTVVAGEAVPGVCDDAGQEICGTPADLAACQSTSVNCGTLSACSGTTACNQYDFWTTFEKHLDKTRTGCSL